MNDNLKNYRVNPDPEVWERIQKTIRRKAVRRQALTAAAGAVIVASAIVAVVNWPSAVTAPATQPSQQVAQVNTERLNVQQAALPEPAKLEVAEPVTAQMPAEPVAKVLNPTQSPAAAPQQEAKVEPRPAVAKEAPVVPVALPKSESVAETAPTVAEPEPQLVVEQPVVTPQPAKSASKSAVTVPNEDTILWFPNVFIPGSGDEEINIFRPRMNHSGDVISNYKMTIFNRGGSQVFLSSDINNGWDGTFRGREMPQATYVYVVYFTDRDGFRHQRKGTITLIR